MRAPKSTPQRFVSQNIKPVTATADTAAMARGEPGLPREFIWGDRTLRIISVIRTWRETGPCTHGSGESYVRKHWFEVVTDRDETASIYFERRPRGHQRSERWWLFSIGPAESTPDR